jgi:hypothetical protein
LDPIKPLTAFVGEFYVGTERLGRPLTNPESRQLDAHLRRHDFVGASLVSLNFALKLRRGNRGAAEDLRGRANLRLVRLGWNVLVIALVKCLCRYVWSEHTHEKRESATTRKAEETYLREQGIHVGTTSPSAEDVALRAQDEREEEARNDAQFEALRASFTEAKDEVNLLWLDYSLEDITDPEEMARRSKLDVSEFYNAQKRRGRHVARLAAIERMGAKLPEKKP